MKKILVILILIFAAGCVEMRDYTGRRNGCLTLLNKHQFGDGAASCDYYRIPGDTYVVRNDTKDEVVNRLGQPDKIVYELGGSEAWTYKKKNLKLKFTGSRLKAFGKINETAH